MENTLKHSTGNTSDEGLLVRIKDGLVCDRLNILSTEYSVSTEYLVTEAARHLLDDVDFVRGLRKKD